MRLSVKQILEIFPEAPSILTRNKRLYETVEIKELLDNQTHASYISKKMSEAIYSKENIGIANDFLLYLFRGSKADRIDLSNKLYVLAEIERINRYKAFMARNPNSEILDVDSIKQIPIARVCMYLGLDIKENMACCPYHVETTPSFRIYQNTNSFYCFGCNCGGDTIKLIVDIEKVTFRKACQILQGL